VCHEDISKHKAEKGLASRGKSLVDKAIKEQKQEFLPKNSILYNAWNWGVKILHVEEAKLYIEQKKRGLQDVKKSESSVKPLSKRPVRRKAKPQKLKNPFLKVEDTSGVNQNCTKQDGGNPVCPTVRGAKKRGYCECCLKKYDDLESHLLSQQHKSFSQSTHYQVVDDLICTFDFDFVDWSKYRNQMKSVETFMVPMDKGKDKPEGNQPIKLISQKNYAYENEHTSFLKTNLFKDEAHLNCIKTDYCTKQTLSPLCTPPDSCSMHFRMNFIKPVANAATVSPKDCLGDCFNYTDEKNTVFMQNTKEKNISEIPQELNLIEPSPMPPIQECDPKLRHLSKEELKISSSPSFPAIDLQMFNSDLPAYNSPFVTLDYLQTKERTEEKRTSEKLHSSKPCLDSSNHSSDCSPSGTLYRKVKNKERKNRNPCQIDKCVNKVSLARDDSMLSSPKSLSGLFQSSGDKSEFLGFTESNPCSMEDVNLETTQGSMLRSLFSSTTSSASTFVGF
ncbi:protein DBF4 homolog A, partial [Bombina bombina]|uniref:protein DBF4 homolog A n=1 Tax=Bombina bombina TaxID=8345 RepID=UPI00235A8316